MWRLVENPYGDQKSIVRIGDNGVHSMVPADPDNADYKEFLLWLADGNVPEED
jgi:hypothetical protein